MSFGMRGLAVVLSLLLAGSAVAQERDRFDIITPPASWESQPYRAENILIRHVHVFRLQKICPQFKLADGSLLSGCVVMEPGVDTCFVFLRDDGIHQDMYASLMRHELAHCRGWPGDHPD